LFPGGRKSSPGCSASSASNHGSYRTANKSAAHYPRSATHGRTTGSSIRTPATPYSCRYGNDSGDNANQPPKITHC
jgi:hypothetical protein